MLEKQVFQKISAMWTALAVLFGLVACQSGQFSMALSSAKEPSRTRTPFQAVSPTQTVTQVFAQTQFPEYTPVPTNTAIVCQSEQGSIQLMELEYKGYQIELRLYLPPCYGESVDMHYPVLYMLHGQTYQNDQWDRIGIDEAADELIMTRQAPPFLIVMPTETNTFEDIFVSPFPDELIYGVIPWVDANFLTCSERDCRAIGGLSRGGAWALRLGFTHWDLFGSIGLHSTPPFIGDPDRFPTWLQAIPADQTPRLYMDTGNRDWFIDSTREFEEILVTLSVAHEWYLFNGTHDEAYWSAHLNDYLMWYTRPWQSMDW